MTTLSLLQLSLYNDVLGVCITRYLILNDIGLIPSIIIIIIINIFTIFNTIIVKLSTTRMIKPVNIMESFLRGPTSYGFVISAAYQHLCLA